MEVLIAKNIDKSFGNQVILKDFNLTVKAKEIVGLSGKSGTGKTTFMRLINNLDRVDGGMIMIDNTVLCKNGVYADKKEVLTYQRKIGLVFQDYQLFPNLNVLDNLLEAPLSLKLDNKDNLIAKAELILNDMGLKDKLSMKPSTLSGGERQRVAIARALMLEPKVLCFDEPTSALDYQTVMEISKLIKKIADKGTAVLIVSHDIDFVSKNCDRIIDSEVFNPKT